MLQDEAAHWPNDKDDENDDGNNGSGDSDGNSDCEYDDDGCNVISADFETNKLNVET